jgi:hypothetical protein
MRSSQIRRQTKETVSLEELEKKLPESCYTAVVNSLQDNVNSDLDDSIYRQYFEAEPTPVLTEEEQKELFEQLGNNWVKNHYSTAELRALVDKPSVSSKSRRHE